MTREEKNARARALYAEQRDARRARARELYTANRGVRASKERARYATASPEARAKRAARSADYRRRNPAKVAEWRAKYRGRYREKNKARARLYNWTRVGAQLPTRPEPLNCECCGALRGKKALNLDHCHSTGAFRGWLCWACNSAIGKLGDSLEGVKLAVAYLERVANG